MSYGTASDETYRPVTDWLNDWDWLDPQWGSDAIEIWNGVRGSGCPMAFTERYGRAWMPVTMDAVSQVAHDTAHFSSQWVSVSMPDAPRRPAPPITSDPPDHHGHRRLLLPPFSPRAIAAMEDDLRRYCRDLVAALAGRETADASADYSQHLPVHAIAQMIGVPESDADLFRDWIFRNFQLAPRDNAVRAALLEEMRGYAGALLAARRDDPRDDLASLIATAEIDGQRVPEDLQRGYIVLLILAGIDTTWSVIGSGLWHLGTHPGDRDRLVEASDDDPIWTTATEEMLRYYAPVTMARRIIADTEVAGRAVRVDEQMLLPFPAANHDPDAFVEPERFDVGRQVNRHVAFGLGVHRCLGSNLARLELRIAVQEWLRAFPRYCVDETQQTTWSCGQVRGPRSVPVLLDS